MIVIRSQYSIEYILIFAFSLLIIIPLIALIHSEYSESKGTLDVSQAKKILDDISVAAQSVYYSGYPSRTTLDMYFPIGLDNISYANVMTPSGAKSELVFIFKASGSYSNLVTVMPFRIDSSLGTHSGRRSVVIKVEQNGIVNITD